MNKAASILKYCTIIVNSVSAIFLTKVAILTRVNGPFMLLLFAVVFCPIPNVILLALSKRLLAGTKGLFFLRLSSVLNLCSLLGGIAGLVLWGLPGNPIELQAVIIWLVLPIITLPTIFLVRSRLNKNDASGVE